MLKVFAEPVAADAAQAGAAGSPYFMLIMWVVIIAVMYFLMIRPQKKKEKEAKAMLAALKVGDKVTTIGGIVGTITKIKDDIVGIETGIGGEKQVIKMERWAIRNVEKKVSEE